MRKILISLVIVLLLVAGYFTMFRGINLFGIEVLSIFQLQDKNKQIDSELSRLSNLTSVEQPKAMTDLNNSAKQLLIAKEEYNDKILHSSSESIQAASQSRPYKTEYLWVVLGNHAKKNSINLKYELRQASSSTSNQYDIYFTVTGSYVSISEFLTSIENDSSLGFKIESFKLTPSTGTDSKQQQDTTKLQATFIVKDVNVEIDNITGATSTTGISQQRQQ